MPELTFATNALGAIRRETHNGRDFIVAPAVSLVEGVLNGEFVPAEEFGRYPQAWDGRPIVIGHPKRNGRHISANRLDVQHVGRVFNTHVDGDKLKQEFWYDVALLEEAGAAGRELLEKLEANETIEISTAYFKDTDPTPGTHGGRRYEAIQRNIRPDHLATLLNTEGACSIRDGCGVPRVNEECEQCAQLEDDTNEGEESDVNDIQSNQMSLDDRIRRVRKAAFERFKQPDGDMPFNIQEVFNSAIIVENEDGLFAYPYTMNDDGIEFDDPTATETVYHDKGTGEPLEINESRFFGLIRKALDALGINPNEFTKESPMDELIQELAANDDVPFGAEELEEFDEERLQAMAALVDKPAANEEEEEETEEAAEAAESGSDPTPDEGGDDVPAWAQDLQASFDALQGEVSELKSEAEAATNAERNQIVERLVANESCTLSKAQLQAMELDVLKGLESSFKPANYGGRGGFHAGSDDGVLIEAPMPTLNGGD